MFRSMKTKSLGMILLFLVTTASIYGFAAQNTVPDSAAGDGSGTICGYTITSVAYTLNATDPGTMDTVAFNVAVDSPCSGNPDLVKVKLEATAGTWYSCTAGTPPAWSCDLTGTALLTADADELSVVAADTTP